MNGNVFLVRIVSSFGFFHHNLWMAWDKSWMVLRELLSVAVSISCLSAFFCKKAWAKNCIFSRWMDPGRSSKILTLTNAVVMALNLWTIWLLRQVFPGSRICRYKRTSLAYSSCFSRISTENTEYRYVSPNKLGV